jgi:hypothetical protein
MTRAKTVGMRLMNLWNDDHDQLPEAGFAAMGHADGEGYEFVVTHDGEQHKVTIKGNPMNSETQVTNKVERKDGGMPEYAFMYPWWSKIDGKPFLSRFVFFRTPWATIDITRIHTDDNQRPWPHDHSRSFVSFKLIGSYDEDVFYDPDDLTSRRRRRHSWLSCHLMRYNMAHSITRVSPVLVTVLFGGPTRRKSSYWTPAGLQPTGVNRQDDWG